MAFAGFTRRFRHGIWVARLAIKGDSSTPTFAPLVFSPTAAPSGTPPAGEIWAYVDTNGVLQVHNGTNYVPGGGGNVVINRPVDANSVDTVAFVADRAYQLVSVEEAHAVAGSDGGAVTLDIKKANGTQAPSAGTTMLAGTINLKGTANTNQTATLSATAANTKLADNDRLCIDVTGTLTALAGGVVTIVLRPI